MAFRGISVTVNKLVSIERKEERCSFKKCVRKRPRKVARRNNKQQMFYSTSNHYFFNTLYEPRAGVNKSNIAMALGELGV